MSAAISIRGINKRYRLGERESYAALRDSLSRAFAMPRRWLTGEWSRRPAQDWLWALRDVSLDVAEGEVLGLVGRNGSGKSTLLKILSRITAPTSGTARLRGRVGSLLEVGTGFHPELTGRENVYVNGAILGMRHVEIAAKFDEIVAFADMDRFIDTPVKFYSSGMQMRLAFAVAAHLEPEILLVDEVLAVGDLAFQKKCLGKMDDVSRSGRTVLFVSHQMNQLRRVCSRCIWLDAGAVAAAGAAGEVVSRYEASFLTPAAPGRPGGGTKGAEFLGWTLGTGTPQQHSLDTFGSVCVTFTLRVDRPIRNAHHGVALRDSTGRIVWGTSADNLEFEPGVFRLGYIFDSLPLRPGPYRWLVTIDENGESITAHDCIPNLELTTSPLGHRSDEYAGFLNLPYDFSITGMPLSEMVGSAS